MFYYVLKRCFTCFYLKLFGVDEDVGPARRRSRTGRWLLKTDQARLSSSRDGGTSAGAARFGVIPVKAVGCGRARPHRNARALALIPGGGILKARFDEVRGKGAANLLLVLAHLRADDLHRLRELSLGQFFLGLRRLL